MKSWITKEVSSKHSPETIARWKDDEKRAKKQFSELKKNPHRHLPMMSPARMAHDDSVKAKAMSKALAKKK